MSIERPTTTPSASNQAALQLEYAEAGHLERLYVQQQLSQLAVFLAAMGGALTVYGNLPSDDRVYRSLTAGFGVLMSLVFLFTALRQTLRVEVARARAEQIEGLLGMALHTQARAATQAARLPISAAAAQRLVYGSAAVVWLFVVVRTLVA